MRKVNATRTHVEQRVWHERAVAHFTDWQAVHAYLCHARAHAQQDRVVIVWIVHFLPLFIAGPGTGSIPSQVTGLSYFW